MGVPGKGAFWFALGAVVLAGSSGIFLTVYHFLYQSLQGDCMDYDELVTGMRREATYSNLMQFFNWYLSCFSTTLPFVVLSVTGFISDKPVQTHEVILSMNILVASAGLFSLLSVLFMLVYPIGKVKHEAILEGIRRHSEGLDAIDPFTKRIIRPHSHKSAIEDANFWLLYSYTNFELRLALNRGVGALKLLLLCFMLLWTLSALAGVFLWCKFPDYYSVWGYVIIFGTFMFLYDVLRLHSCWKVERLASGPFVAIQKYLVDQTW